MPKLPTTRLPSERWILFLLFLAFGCAEQNLLRPSLREASPPAFSHSGETAMTDRWWTSFGDQELNRRVEVALGNSYTLATAMQSLRAARALARRESSDLFGDLNGVVGLTGDFGPGKDSSTLRWGLEGTYPVDIWGEIEARVEAEKLRAGSVSHDYDSIALTLSSEISRTWFTLIEANAQAKLLEVQIETNRTGLELQESRFGLGLIRSADVLRQRQLLESTLEQAVVARSRIEILEHQLAVLLGEMPQSAEYDTGASLPKLPPLPVTGVPSDLLLRRPDVQREFVAFRAADRDLASAVSRQYPRLNLSGSVLNTAESPETILRDWFVSVGGQLIAPLLDGGQRRAEVDRSSAIVAQRFYEYAQAVLTAFAEVEDNLAQEKYQLERIQHLENQVTLAGQSSDQLREQYLIGDAEYLDVLSAITGQQSLQRRLLSAQLELVLIRVDLYRSLAGNFDTRPQLELAERELARDEFDVILEFDEIPPDE